MQEFIKLAASQLGVSEDTGNAATKGVLGMLQDGMDGGDFGSLTSALPGAAELLGGGDDGGGLGGALGGMLGGALGGGDPGGGGLGGMLGGALGGGLGDNPMLAAVMQLAASGLDKEQAGPFIQLFLKFVQDKAGDGLLEKVLAAVPALKALGG
ncbi:MAG: DUF2780 domain-containing protein [Deltaproteobacteria bacterium]|nr:DUF2780 domain-containing protein [Deltaproteobacteria bacterium]